MVYGCIITFNTTICYTKCEVGDRFGRLVVINKFKKLAGKKPRQYEFATCVCDCGNKAIVYVSNLKMGTKSCGCILKKHGKWESKEYGIWCAMKRRCLAKNDKRYKDYGGRGITVSQEWLDFRNFYRDMGDKPLGKSLDRIDNSGNYCKANCRWSTVKEQSRNMRNNRYLVYKGEKKLLYDWADLFGIKRGTLACRIWRGWTVERALKG